MMTEERSDASVATDRAAISLLIAQLGRGLDQLNLFTVLEGVAFAIAEHLVANALRDFEDPDRFVGVLADRFEQGLRHGLTIARRADDPSV